MVRVNAVAILMDIFPLQDPESKNEETDNLMQKQFDILQVQMYFKKTFRKTMMLNSYMYYILKKNLHFL